MVLDTDVLIDTARGVAEAIACLQQVEERSILAISVITHVELLVGCRDKAETRALHEFLLRFRILKLNELISDTGMALLRRYRLSHGLLIPDALIAATALAQGYPLVSKNQRDYRFIEGLGLLPCPRPFSE